MIGLANGDGGGEHFGRAIAVIIVVIALAILAMVFASCVVISQQTGTPGRSVEKVTAKDSGKVLKAQRN